MVTYKDAGVDIAAGAEFVQRLQKLSPDIGGFGGLYPLGEHYLVASTDGVGTKLKLAFAQDRHETVGIDLVAMCVNDIITTGARPLFFLDYFATSKLNLAKTESVLKGIIQGCQDAGCVLLGGETAEMPGFYQEGEYDISGFAVGIVPKRDLIDGKKIIPGDCLVGMSSSGLHSNGFSLVRKILKQSPSPEFDLLEPTRIYANDIGKIKGSYFIKGIAHITGGGLIENIPRMFPEGIGAHLIRKSWTIPPTFDWLQSIGKIPEEEMFRTFNMGIGMVLTLSADEAKTLCQENKNLHLIGEVIEGKGVIFS